MAQPPNPTKTASDPRVLKLIELETRGVIKPEHLQELNAYRSQGRAPPAIALTEAQGKSTGFDRRASGANEDFLGLPDDAQAGRGLIGDALVSVLPENVVNSNTSSERQRARQAKEDFIRASLRYESGAAIGADEFASQDRIFFPQTGDSPETIAQKADARLRVIDSLKITAGPGATMAVPGSAPSSPAPDPDNGTDRLNLLEAPAAALDVATNVRGGPLDVDVGGGSVSAQTPEFRAGLEALLNSNAPKDKILEYWDKNAPGALEKGADPRPAPLATERGEDGIIENADAVVRGAADTATLGLATRGAALADTVSNGGTYAENLARQRGVDEYDEEVNPWARGVGQFAGALAIPSGASAAGGAAESGALAKGMGINEARQAARKAFATRLGAEGAGVAGAYGVNSEYGDWGEKIGAGVRNAVTGGVLSYGLGRAFGVEPPDVPSGPGAPPSPTDFRPMAGRLGIEPTPATTGGGVAAGAQRVLGNLPGSATPIRSAVERETEGLADAARNTADKMGPRGTPQSAGEDLASGAKQWQAGEKTTGNTLYRVRDDMIGGPESPVVMGNTGKQLAKLSNDFPSSPVLASMLEHPAVRKVAAVLEDGNGELNLSEATEALSHIRGVVRNAEASKTITGPMKARVKALESAIEDDVMNAAKASDAINGRSGAFTAEKAQQEADAHWAKLKDAEAGEMKRMLESASDDVKVSGESVFRQMFNDMNRDGGNLQRLRGAWSKLPQKAKDTYSATAFEQLGRAKPGAQNATDDAWSFQTFLTNWSKMSPEARKLAFGGRGVDREIDDIVRYSGRLRDIDKTRNFSNTSPNQLAGGTGIAAMTALLTGNFKTAAGIAGTYAALNGVGRAFIAAPAMRQWMRSALHATVRGATGNKGAESNIQVLIRRLPTIAARNPQIAGEIGALEKSLLSAINDNVKIGSAAASGEQGQDKQKAR